MPLYIYIDESGKLHHETKYQNYTAAVFTNSATLKNFEKQFCEAVKLVAEQSPELVTKEGKEIKG
ncbi:1521_t:CDS:1, partial [Funneliformis geosporum]